MALMFLAGCGWMDRLDRAFYERTVLDSDFETSPKRGGWSYTKCRGDEHDDPWTDRKSLSGSFAIKARPGFIWESPPIAVRPFEYYRLEFKSIAWRPGYWAAIFYDRDGERMLTDHFSSIEPSAEWSPTVSCIVAKAGARWMRIEFRPRGGEIYMDDVSIRRVRRKEVAQWADRVYASIPPVTYTPPEDRWRHIPKAIAKLRAGGTLTVVMLGDSIACDTGTSAWDTLVERRYPGSRVHTITSTRPSTGCRFYMQPGKVKRYVLDYKPDLVIIGGIGGGGGGAVRSVVHQIRAASDAEILVTTGAFGYKQWFEWYKTTTQPATQPTTRPATQPASRPATRPTPPPRGAPRVSGVAKFAAEEKIGYIDTRKAFNEYLLAADKPYEIFIRDSLHANTRGRQIVARIFEAFFAPDGRPSKR